MKYSFKELEKCEYLLNDFDFEDDATEDSGSICFHNLFSPNNIPEVRQSTTKSAQTKSIKEIFEDTDIKIEGMNVDQLVQIVLDMSKNSSNFEEDLLNLLGFEWIEVVSSLVQNRECLLVHSQQASNSTNHGVNTPSSSLSSRVAYPHVYTRIADTNYLTDFGSKFSLPVGTIRDNSTFYEKFTTPAILNSDSNYYSIPTVPISSFSPLSMNAFKGYKSLNNMQSAVFPIAYRTNENILVCAPTGAGKTDIATMVILKAIEDHIVPVVDESQSSRLSSLRKEKFFLDKNAFKIIYIAPMKALVGEITEKFTKKLSSYLIKVKECTGDMQLSKREIGECNIIVTTPEKWDVITRKSTSDAELILKVCLIIIDEVHLLNDSRGPVIESIVSRTLRQIEISQKMIRIVGLSATLPNYVDVALFLRVNPYKGMFCFDSSFRPVPLQQHLVGIKAKNKFEENERINEYVFTTSVESVQNKHQVLIFVHSRLETSKTAKMLIEKSSFSSDQADLFVREVADKPQYSLIAQQVSKCRNSEIREFFKHGIGIHHAGMIRNDRKFVEKLFSDGYLMILCCTATLAWGVNLPAHTVIIKGTNIYDASRGGFADLNILDVLQIFGRAGRPQFEVLGEAYLLTNHDRLYHYINMLISQVPIESQFKSLLADNLNAEIALGSISNVTEAISWLKCTYLYIRLRKNPHVYGITPKEFQQDPSLTAILTAYIHSNAKRLRSAGMVGYDEVNGFLKSRDLGRVASLYYLRVETVEKFNKSIKPNMFEDEILGMICDSSEFSEGLKVRESEVRELDSLAENYAKLKITGHKWEIEAKVNALVQCWISRGTVHDFGLQSDLNYISQNFGRVSRAVFEIMVNIREFGNSSRAALNICQSFEHQLWWNSSHPLEQFPNLKRESIGSVVKFPMESLREMSVQELLHHCYARGNLKPIFSAIQSFPFLSCQANIQPISSNVLRVNLEISSDFVWNISLHGKSIGYWIWILDDKAIVDADSLLHSEIFHLASFQASSPKLHTFTIPIAPPLPNQIFVQIISDRWIGCDVVIPISYTHLILPEAHPFHTDLLQLEPLHISALKSPEIELLYPFKYFNPIQTQLFHVLYHSQVNVLLGAPTGSGKTITAELGIWNALRNFPHQKIVYIAPLKALVKERLNDWLVKFAKIGLKVVELTGDTTPDILSLTCANVIVTTPEKWDGVSRDWKRRKYIKSVSLVIFDEIHLLAGERGPVLEVIVSRLRHISSVLHKQIRLIGLSTALANARDLADWLGIERTYSVAQESLTGNAILRNTNDQHDFLYGLFNFRPSVRPVPLQVYIEGFHGIHYCPRMATMNKPCYNAILTHSPDKPVIIFVSSRRQTRLTAQGIISYTINCDRPKRFLKISEEQLTSILSSVADNSLKNTLSFGIGLHHAGLIDMDRKIVEELFLQHKIQVLIATSTLAWGVNFPAHLVIVKGTEYFDSITKEYIDYPITDVLQMMGRAGRPQWDDSGKAVIFVHDCKKAFYKKFLYEPFPVESALQSVLADHLNAEICAEVVNNLHQALSLLKWTFLYRRAKLNPSYYGIQDGREKTVTLYLESLIKNCLEELESSRMIEHVLVDNSTKYVSMEKSKCFQSTPYGKIASFYYVQHCSIRRILSSLKFEMEIVQLIQLICDCEEFCCVPVRHNEEVELSEFFPSLPVFEEIKKENLDFTSPNVKAFILMIAHIYRIDLPVDDFITDTITILGQSTRVIQAMVDCVVEKDKNCLSLLVNIVHVFQMLKQAAPLTSPSTKMLPFKNEKEFQSLKCQHILELIHNPAKYLARASLSNTQEIKEAIEKFPTILLSNMRINGRLSIGQLNSLSMKISKKFPNGKWASVYCPRFPKTIEEEMHYVIIGCANHVFLVKRVMFSPKRNELFLREMNFFVPLINAFEGKPLQIRLMNDSYIGLDQYYEFDVFHQQ